MAAYDDDEGWQSSKPDMIIGSKNRVRGDIKFDGLLRVDGTIEGRITAPIESRIVISPCGCFLGDLTGLAAAYIDGKVVGDVSVEQLVRYTLYPCYLYTPLSPPVPPVPPCSHATYATYAPPCNPM
jgi:cytoskeletal protein CcmA (bactofilin family)